MAQDINHYFVVSSQGRSYWIFKILNVSFKKNMWTQGLKGSEKQQKQQQTMYMKLQSPKLSKCYAAGIMW